MKLSNLQKNFYILFSLVASVLIATILWDKITLPLNNTIGARGILVEKGYNPNNDTIRYIFFITFPIILFFFLNLIFKKKKININQIIFEKEEKVQKKEYILVIPSLIFVLLIILEFLSLNLSNYRLDLLHDGDFLTPALNYFHTKNFWISSYTVHGGSDILYPVLMWKIFGIESIGAARSYFIFLILMVKLLSVFLAYQLTKISNLTKENKVLFSTIFSLVLISMSHYNFPLNYSYFSYRDIYVILFLIFFINLFAFSEFRTLYTILISIIAVISIFFHIDIGVYLNLILAFYIFYLFFLKKYGEISLIILSAVFTLFFAIYLIGVDEFKAFLDHTTTIIFSMDLMHGLKYPVPFFSMEGNQHGARATRGLLLQLTAGLLVLNYMFSDQNKITSSKKILFIFFFFLSFIMYKNALGRSDATHIRMSTDLPILINCFFILNYFLIYIEKKNKIKNFLNQKTFFIISAAIVILFYILNHNNYRIENIINFNNNFSRFINLKDNDFIDQKTVKFLTYYKRISENDSCIQNFTFDLAIPYLLKKPSCTKYFSSWLASPIVKQKDYINQIKKIRPTYILYRSSATNYDVYYGVDALETHKRLQLVNSFILSNYKQHYEADGYIILKKN
tara:strand:- start:1152 stop:3023 length:1872 start_codon:yes stop_codon:yes gene_type:complete